MALPRLDEVDDLDDHHLLVLPAGIGPDSVEILATSRFPRATWETPSAPSQVGARAPRLARQPPGVLRLSRLTTLAGPYQVDRGTATELGLPVGAGTAYLLATPTERGDPPWPGTTGDRDGLALSLTRA